MSFCGKQTKGIGGLRCSSKQATTTNAGKLKRIEVILHLQGNI
jgi:hypothetical protein